MKTTDEKRLLEVVMHALGLPEAQRQGFVQQACGDDLRLLAEAMAMLGGDDDLGDFLETPPPPVILTPEEPLTEIGPYKILGLLGEGGMGRVLLAQQTEPLRRKVALKLIRHGAWDPRTTARFDAERQAMARLSHPNIGQVYDAGTTADGTPYFAMEHVEGSPITVYCDYHQLTVEKRLHLFTRVCLGVQHAHQKQILHRDLKPSNILVTEVDGEAIPKIIDFGIAKGLDQPLTEATLATGAQLLGTPSYMSPEALGLDSGGIDVDTRSDVYSLGVLLYVLLTGKRPFGGQGTGVARILRQISETDPSRPSARLGSTKSSENLEIAKERNNSIGALRRQLAGELDWIVMKAIAKQRDERYGSAAELARDVEHFLRHEPVQANPPSARYVLRKFLRRNLSAVLAATVIVAVVALAIGLLTRARWHSERLSLISEQLGREVERIEWVQRVAHQLPLHDLSETRQTILRQMQRIEANMASVGKVGQAPSHYAIGRGYLALRNPSAALDHLQSAWDAGYRRPDVSLALGQALGKIYEKRLKEARRSPSSEIRAALTLSAEQDYRQPALAMLEQSRGADMVAPELLGATIAFYDGDLERALAESDAAAERLPWLYEARLLAANVWLERARIAKKKGEVETARKGLEQSEEILLQALAIGRSDPLAHLALCATRSERLSLAIRYSKTTVREQRKLAMQGLRLAALEACATARQADPSFLEINLQEAHIWLDTADIQTFDFDQDPAEALSHLPGLLQNPSADTAEKSEAHRLLGRAEILRAVHARYNSLDPRPAAGRAISQFERALELNPKHYFAHVHLAEIYFLLSGYRPEQNPDLWANLAAAERHARVALKEKPDLLNAHHQLSGTLVLQAYHSLRLGRDPLAAIAAAGAAYDAYLHIDPEHWRLYSNAANAPILGGRWQALTGENPTDNLRQALEKVGRALAVSPEDGIANFVKGEIHRDLALFQLSQGLDPTPEVEQGLRHYRTGLAAIPNMVGPHINLAQLNTIVGEHLLRAGHSPLPRTRQAEKDARRALELERGSLEATVALAEARLLSVLWIGKQSSDPLRLPAGSEQELQTVIAANPNDARPRLTLARMIWRTQGAAANPSVISPTLVQTGLEEARKAYTMNPSLAEALALEGALLHLQADDPEQAQQAVAKVLQAIERNSNLSLAWKPWLAAHQ